MKTTFQTIKDHCPCGEGWKKLIKFHQPKGLNQEVSFAEILRSNGIKDAVWALRVIEDKKKVMLFSADVAESVLHIFEAQYPDNKELRECIDAIRGFVAGTVTAVELEEKRYAAAAAADAAAADAAAAAAYATTTAAAAAAAADAAYATYAAAADADAAAAAASYAAKWDVISELFTKHFC